MNEIEETMIEPELCLCDAHHHLWDNRDDEYTSNEFLQDIGGQNVVKTVCVEAWGYSQRNGVRFKKPSEQTAFVIADSENRKGSAQIAAAIVGHANLMEGDKIGGVIEAHIREGQGRFRGIRLPPGSVYNDAKFNEGLRHIEKNNLTIDLLVEVPQFPYLKELASRYPGVPFIINHLGSVPPGRPGEIETKKDREEKEKLCKKMIENASECPNLFMKLGGLGMDLNSTGWNQPVKPDSIELAGIMKKCFTHWIDVFGPGRCMLESNFPMDKKSFSYNVFWNAAKRFSQEYSESERDSLFFNTAAKAYRL